VDVGQAGGLLRSEEDAALLPAAPLRLACTAALCLHSAAHCPCLAAPALTAWLPSSLPSSRAWFNGAAFICHAVCLGGATGGVREGVAAWRTGGGMPGKVARPCHALKLPLRCLYLPPSGRLSLSGRDASALPLRWLGTNAQHGCSAGRENGAAANCCAGRRGWRDGRAGGEATTGAKPHLLLPSSLWQSGSWLWRGLVTCLSSLLQNSSWLGSHQGMAVAHL